MNEIANRYGNSIIEPAANAIDSRLLPQHTKSVTFDGRAWLLSSPTSKAENIISANPLPYQLDHSDPSVYYILNRQKHTQKFLELNDSDIEIKTLLQSKTVLSIVFVPVDDAFEGFDPKEFTKDYFCCHISLTLLPIIHIENETIISV